MRPAGLSADQKAFYAEKGYILAKGVFTPAEAAEFRAEAHALADRLMKIKNIDATWQSVRKDDAPSKTIIYHCHDVQFQSALFTRMVYDPRLTAIAADVVGPNVQLHHTKMFIKPPEKGSPFPMHQDHPYFPHQNHSMTAAVIHFDDAPIAKGCLRVVPGSHKLGPLEPDNKGDFSLSPEKYPIESATPCEAQPGDVLFFNYLTIHGSGVNVSPEARTTVLLQMRDPMDPPLYRTHESRGQGMMLAGFDPSCATMQPLAERKPRPA
ncbi:phytanoyl-CoA dioxygenase family protein [soil metagenome]